MKLTASVGLVLVVLATLGIAQNPNPLDSTIRNLQQQIQMREALDRDSRTAADYRAQNRRALEDKRTELRLVVQKRIGQLRDYLKAVDPSAMPEQRRDAETMLRYLLSISDVASISPAPTANGTRARVIGQPRTATYAPQTTPANSYPSLVRLEAVREGDSTIRGWSDSTVSEIVVEIRTRDFGVRNPSGAAYSHTLAKKPITQIVYRVLRSSSYQQSGNSWAFIVKLERGLTASQEIRAMPNGAAANSTQWTQVGMRPPASAIGPIATLALPQGGPLPPSEHNRYNLAIQFATGPGQAGYPAAPTFDYYQCSMPGTTDFHPAYLNWQTGSLSPSIIKRSGTYCFQLTSANTVLYTYDFNASSVGPSGSPLDILNDAITAIKNVPKAAPPVAPAAPSVCDTLNDEVENVKQAALALDQDISSLDPGKSGDKSATVSIATTLSAWAPIPAKFAAYENAVDNLRQQLITTGWDPSCRTIKDADDLILVSYRKARDAYLTLQARVSAPHVAAFTYEIDSGDDVTIKVSELYKGSPTAAPIKTYQLTHGYTAITSSAGFMMTTLPARSYSSVTAPDPANPTTNQNVLGVDYGRGTRLAMTALLNYNLPFAARNDFGIALSVGPVFDISNGKADTSRFGLFGGVGVRLSKWMYVTPGVHIGEFADFPQGYNRVGQVIPANSGTPAPIKRYTSRFAVAVTFKVKDLWTPTPAPANNSSGSK